MLRVAETMPCGHDLLEPPSPHKDQDYNPDRPSRAPHLQAFVERKLLTLNLLTQLGSKFSELIIFCPIFSVSKEMLKKGLVDLFPLVQKSLRYLGP